jgi:hypothetical protein
MPRTTAPKLAVVPDRPTADPAQAPAHLTGVGLELWQRISSEFSFADPGSYEVLAQACFAATRADRCREIIDRDGELLRVGKLIRSNPLLRDEIQNRALCARLLGKLGLDLEQAAPMPPVPHPRGR